MVRRRAAFLLILCGALAACVGCPGGRDYRIGREAELKGDASAAYDAYCRVGASHRNAHVGLAIERVSREAADEAESAALAAMDRGDYADAWRLFMRVLAIQPGHANAPQLIRRLEREHPDAVASARSDYMVRGSAMLAMARPTTAPKAVAMAEPRTPRISEERAEALPQPAGSAETPRSDSESTSRDETIDQFARADERRAPIQPEATAPELEPVPTAVRETHETREPLPALGRQLARSEPAPPGPRTATPLKAQQRGAYKAIHTLSKRDRRYPRVVETFDGIRLRLEDTESDLEVDIDVFDGRRRIKKIRDLELGRSQTYRGKTDTLYRVTILGVHHKSHTIRVGIGPA